MGMLRSIPERCAKYPYEVLVFYLVILIGLLSLPHSKEALFQLSFDESEFHSLIIVARCLAILHTSYQIKKLRLFHSFWLAAAMAIFSLVIFSSFVLLSSMVASFFPDSKVLSWSTLIPLCVLVTEMDFPHALLLTSSESVANKETIPQSIASATSRLGLKASSTSLLDIFCLGSVILYNRYDLSSSGMNFALAVSIICVLLQNLIFFTLVPSLTSLILYWFPRAPLKALTDDGHICLLTQRALSSLKFGSGFEVSILVTSTFVLAQSKKMRIFRYLILDNVRRSRARHLSSSDKPLKNSSARVRRQSDSFYDFDSNEEIRDLEEMKQLLSEKKCDLMNNSEILFLLKLGLIRPYALEKILQDATRGVVIRRRFLGEEKFRSLPYQNYDFEIAAKACCENIVGYVPIPLGVVGPILVDGRECSPLLATTEGALLASVNRGCKVIKISGGAKTSIFRDEMSRAPCVSFPSTAAALDCFQWLEDPYNFTIIKDAFETTTRFGKLLKVTPYPAGRLLFLRFSASTGDAMGMNMVSKGTNKAVDTLLGLFPSAKLESISGNACTDQGSLELKLPNPGTDKKPSAMNWINGRGKTIIAEVSIPEKVLVANFKCTAKQLADLNVRKNLIGSNVAGSIGGFNAHAANIVAACFIASGQDAAQVVEGSQTMTLFEERVIDSGNGLISLE
ncbi:Oidioi.mRNA.OKI2018_I69.chr1.g2527.t2.cds [Oikopleura dioica]|uniref:3-hydroxy-3-methylglutaryl-coenzyme A reductase n=1 Tax=Oikopleura dioica TaxID=34765 RepID=A0ABN7SRY4_OIKDI|nr:Oidioi.mRNA.OKI2018_I69.chr1.g2527.t2.cds [Oikopleura dioica]